jgi:hypothetical protein
MCIMFVYMLYALVTIINDLLTYLLTLSVSCSACRPTSTYLILLGTHRMMYVMALSQLEVEVHTANEGADDDLVPRRER